MKPLTKNLLITIIACPLLGLLIGAAAQQAIRWHSDGLPIFQAAWTNGHHIDFGLRSDGIVVWREIHPATTNSPTEDNTIRIDPGGTNSFYTPRWDWTNIVVTNFPTTNKWYIDTNYLRLNKATTPVTPSTPFEAWLLSLETP